MRKTPQMLMLALTSCGLALFAAKSNGEEIPDFAEIQPIIEKYCYECHGGTKKEAGLDLTNANTFETLLVHRKDWVKAQEALEFEEMPPAKSPQPSSEERSLVSNWLLAHVVNFNAEQYRSPGAGMVRLLTVEEYGNTIQDLLNLQTDVVAEAGIDQAAPTEHYDTEVNMLTPSLLTAFASDGQRCKC